MQGQRTGHPGASIRLDNKHYSGDACLVGRLQGLFLSNPCNSSAHIVFVSLYSDFMATTIAPPRTPSPKVRIRSQSFDSPSSRIGVTLFEASPFSKSTGSIVTKALSHRDGPDAADHGEFEPANVLLPLHTLHLPSPVPRPTPKGVWISCPTHHHPLRNVSESARTHWPFVSQLRMTKHQQRNHLRHPSCTKIPAILCTHPGWSGRFLIYTMCGAWTGCLSPSQSSACGAYTRAVPKS
jgi:hypothetical protein